jgi:UDP-N-acetylglucosamine acyltransferase
MIKLIEILYALSKKKYVDENDTCIGNNNIILRGGHVGHDVIIENDCTISCNVLLGGFSKVMSGVNCGLGVIIHQYSVLGQYSMLGMGTIVTKSSKIEPGNIYVGSPAKLLKRNDVGLSRANITPTQYGEFVHQYHELILSK